MVARDYARARRRRETGRHWRRVRREAWRTLHRLPIGIKDLEDTEALRTTYGSVIFRAHVPTTDDLIVANVKKAGAIVLGKTNTPEWGAGANTRNAVYGVTGNTHSTRTVSPPYRMEHPAPHT
jgi:Asp-tRNA(Asn)/Glu-tRNA(Gln) amidotransferase A subunit family amidase